MNLKNYTSEVQVAKTISRIEETIAKFGASHIAKEYTPSGQVASLQFMISENGRPHVIKLPANIEKVFQAMMKEYKQPQRSTETRVREQAQRTAWKIMQDWVEVQLSIVTLNQAEIVEVFLPCIYDGQQTYYQNLKGSNFKQLPPPR